MPIRTWTAFPAGLILFNACALILLLLTVMVFGRQAPDEQEWPQRTSNPGERATPTEVVAKVREAATLLAKEGEAALIVLRDSTSSFTWKHTYVFVVNCGADEVVANPAFPERQGGDIKQHADYAGNPYGRELCEAARAPAGGWVEYVWLKPGGHEPSRKVSYVMAVEGRPYQVGAGIYDDTTSTHTLTHLLGVL